MGLIEPKLLPQAIIFSLSKDGLLLTVAMTLWKSYSSLWRSRIFLGTSLAAAKGEVVEDYSNIAFGLERSSKSQ
jgi:hypothetical protein